MKSRFSVLPLFAAFSCCFSCVEVDPQLGFGLVATNQQYQTHVIDLPVPDINSTIADSLTGYSKQKITIGSIADSDYGLSSRASALTLIPINDTLNFGKVQKVSDFTFFSSFDTTAVADDSQKRILQSVEVYALEESTLGWMDANKDIAHSSSKINIGTPLIDGASNLVFRFTEDFGNSFVGKVNGMVMKKDFNDYLDAFPGIYIKTSDPTTSEGGRINMFGLQLGVDTSQGYITENYAEITLNSIYDDAVGAIDTTFYFIFGLVDNQNVDSLLVKGTIGDLPSYALNLTKHSSSALEGKAGSVAYIEGGCGLKPRIGAWSLTDDVYARIVDTLTTYGKTEADITGVTINKATVYMPFEMPADYNDLKRYPVRLSPTTRVRTDTTSFFMNLTDYSNSSENQGDVNLSLLRYEPDITYHLQSMLALRADAEKADTLKSGNYDVWMLPMAEETVTTTTASSDNDMNEYYQYMMYQNYYNSMYGGYNSSSSYYNNYYSYMMMQQYANQSSSKTTKTYELDKDRFYKGTLNGPSASSGNVPHIKVTFTFRKAQD